MAAAIMLARRGARVAVLERDPQHPIDVDHAWRTWHRPGVPQLRHVHSFSAAAHAVLARELPDVLRAITANGARIVPLTVPGGDQSLALGHVVRCRRTTLEHALSEAAHESGVVVRRNVAVTAVAVAGGTVQGVHTANGGTVPAELVVDCAGQAATRSLIPRTRRPIDLSYMTAWYHLRRPESVPPQGIRGNTHACRIALTPADGPWVSITVIARSRHCGPAPLTDRHEFESVVTTVSEIADVLAAGSATAIGSVRFAPRLVNAISTALLPGWDGPRGLIPLGDAAVTTNPVVARGVGLGLITATNLCRALETTDPHHTYLARTSVDAGRWFADSIDHGQFIELQLRAAGSEELSLAEAERLAELLAGRYKVPTTSEEVAMHLRQVNNLDDLDTTDEPTTEATQ